MLKRDMWKWDKREREVYDSAGTRTAQKARKRAKKHGNRLKRRDAKRVIERESA